jgi:hypothetical protein
MRDEIMMHLLKILRNEQHGFVARKSCVTYLMEALDIVTKCSFHRCIIFGLCKSV